MVSNLLCSPDRPFVAAVRPERYFPSASAERARDRLQRVIERAEGIGVLIGDCGVGKTLLCRRLAMDAAGRYDVILLAETRIRNRGELLQQVLAALHLPFSGRSEAVMRQNLLDYLAPAPGKGEGLLLIADEADNLPKGVLDELRIWSGIVREHQPRVRVIMAGSPRLDEHLSDPRLVTLAHRIVARCYLQPMDGREMAAYVRHQLRVARWPVEAIDDSAIDAAYKATDGNPRMANQLFDHAMVLAANQGAAHLHGDLIRQAHAELEQLPLGMAIHRPAATTPSIASIEFGELTSPDAALPVSFEPIAPQASHRIREDLVVGPRSEDCFGAQRDGAVGFDRLTRVLEMLPDDRRALRASPNSEASTHRALAEGASRTVRDQFAFPELPPVRDPFGPQFDEEIPLAHGPVQMRVTELSGPSIEPRAVPTRGDEAAQQGRLSIRSFHLASDGPVNHVTIAEIPDELAGSSWFELGDDGDLLVVEEDLIEWQSDDAAETESVLRSAP